VLLASSSRACPRRSRAGITKARAIPDHRHRRRSATDGQVLVFHDVMGMTTGKAPQVRQALREPGRRHLAGGATSSRKTSV